MPTAKIPISGPAYKNVDEVALETQLSELIDGYTDETGSLNRRPGLSLWTTLGATNPFASVDGAYWWDEKGLAIIIHDGVLWKTDNAGGAFTKISGDALTPGKPVSFTTDGTDLLMANGGRIVRWNTSLATTAYIADADAPTNVSHVAFLDGYIIANSVGTGKFFFSDLNSTTSWNALSFVTAESLPDNILALDVRWRELLLFGRRSIDNYLNDGSTPFVRRSGSYIERGCGAANSVVFAGNVFWWLDDTRRFVSLEGRTPKVVSTPFDKTIQDLGTVDDCFGMYIEASGRSFLVWQFPTANLTLAYELLTQRWMQWGFWNTTTAVYDRFVGNAYAWMKDFGFRIVGDRRSDKIYKISRDFNDDAGDEMRTLVKTGLVTHGTLREKRSDRIKFRFRRGDGIASGAEPVIMYRFKDNNSTWSQEQNLGAGKSGETDFEVELRRQGLYKSRRHEISITDNIPLVLVDIEEDFTVLGV